MVFSSCTSRHESGPPNILFCIADDASYPHMGAYGTSWIKTPAFDEIARQGILFSNCYTPNAKCAPSRACILTGRNTWQLEEACNHQPFFPVKFGSFAEALDKHGYHVGYTAKGWAPGKAFTESGEPRDLLVRKYNEHKTTPPARYISGIDYAANLEAFLDENEQGKPFFFWYGSTEPHRRYEYNAGISKAGKKLSDMDDEFPLWPDIDSVITDLLDYAFEIEYFDQHLQKMLVILEEKGLMENTIVVVTADNGMPFPRIKGQEYELSNHLPLAIRWPDGIKNPGRVVDDFVNFIDFAPTFLEMAGISEQTSGMQPIEGKSLAGIFRSGKSGMIERERDHVLIGKERHDVGRPMNQGYPIRGMVKGEYLYIMNFEPERWPAGNPETGYLNCDGSPTKTLLLDRYGSKEHFYWQWNFGKRPAEELFNIKDDPFCMKNLAGEKSFNPLKEQLRLQMLSELKAQNDPRMVGEAEVFENYLNASHPEPYYQKYMSGEVGEVGWVNRSDYRPEQGDLRD